MSRLLILLLLVNLYVLVLLVLYRRRKLGGDLDLVLGFLLMWRTQRGKAAIERIAKPKPFWGAAGDVGIVLTVIAGVLTLLVVLLQVALFALAPRQAAASTPTAEYLLGIPGINPLIPIGYGILGLAVALVVHEGAHGVLARAGDIKVKSLGLLFAVVPVGAFVEPDEEELERSTTRRKLRVFAAGPASNLVLAVVAAVVFSSVIMASTSWDAPDGVLVRGVTPDSPAAQAGLQPGDVITKINGQPVPTYAAFSERMNGSKAGDSVQVSYARPGQGEVSRSVALADRYEYLRALGATPPESDKGKGALGFGPLPLNADRYHDVLVHPLASLPAFGTYLYHPFFALLAFDPLAEPYSGWIEVHGPLGALPDWSVFMLANVFYWLFWLNLMLGTFNALPMGPLDGGQMFKAALKSRLYRRYGVEREKVVLERPIGSPVLVVRGADPETQAKLDRVQVVLKRATWAVGFTLLGLLLLPIIVGNVLKAVL